MRNILIKTAVAGFLCLGLASCADDLNISSIDPQSSPVMMPTVFWLNNMPHLA